MCRSSGPLSRAGLGCSHTRQTRPCRGCKLRSSSRHCQSPANLESTSTSSLAARPYAHCHRFETGCANFVFWFHCCLLSVSVLLVHVRHIVFGFHICMKLKRYIMKHDYLYVTPLQNQGLVRALLLRAQVCLYGFCEILRRSVAQISKSSYTKLSDVTVRNFDYARYHKPTTR